ncbi:hypothetical protein [Burkholderia sp. Ac-20344]|uniref:hypothetical protein n=1 Tax=Burkholderia sp. Ac-20344 TaxID=2703890 RepID=UPI00197B69F7|nr:hypothetical protein [Burkholderia sp. Ac-20344]MBN3836157.1 hypothetical protein [Burkholderia sp. Ac-20344]
MTATRLAARTRARRPLVCALTACALSLGIPPAAQAAVLTPEQTTDLYLGAFINGDASKAVQFNDATRTRFEGKDALDVAAIPKLADTLRDNIVAAFMAKVPAKVRATVRGPVTAAVASYQHALARSECKATGSTRKPNESVEGESIATVEFACRVADVEPGMKALREKLGNPRLKNDNARAAFLVAFFNGTVPVFDNAPTSRTMTGRIDLYGTDDKGWITGSPGGVLPPVVNALLGQIRDADGEAGK